MKVHIEVTDTFGGEANYSWVKRESFETDKDISDIAIVRRAKALMGYSGVRISRREQYGDSIVLWGLGGCIVMFISFEY